MNKLTVLRCIYLFLFLFSFLNALKGQLHIAQGRVTERQRSDGTLGLCMVHTIQRPEPTVTGAKRKGKGQLKIIHRVNY